MSKIGIFGGVFNPPHNFHVTVANQILLTFHEFERIIFVPVGNNYKKPEIINAEHRYNMLKLICDKNKNFDVSRIEIDSDIQPYAYQTLDTLSKSYPNSELVFIIGTDSLKTLDTWKNIDYLLSTYSFLVYPRGTDNFNEIIENNKIIKPYKNKFIFMKTSVISDLSSTFIRKQIKKMASLPVENDSHIIKEKKDSNIKLLLPDNVYEYIKEKHLYL